MDTASQGAVPPGAPVAEQQDQFLARIGHMTRSLHDNLRGLGFDRWRFLSVQEADFNRRHVVRIGEQIPRRGRIAGVA